MPNDPIQNTVRRVARLAPLLVLLACGRGAPAPDAGWSRVEAAAFAQELAAAPAAGAAQRIIVDVREPELFREGHIPGAINMPWPDTKTRAPAELPKDADIVFVCHGGPMGDEVAAILAAQGFGKVRNVAGGMRAWTGPLEKAS